ncbi:MAG: N,N-dimethylformamidase beta subunit family domain-containing protein [Gemmataceae bacterium]
MLLLLLLASAELAYTDVNKLTVEGRAWADLAAPFDRLPASAQKLVRPAVWGLSRHSAGMAVRFRTDATTLAARWTLTGSTLALPHMPATGVSGLDLYVRVGGKWRWLANGRPTAKTNTMTVAGLAPGPVRDYLLYLPLYNGVSSVEVGVPDGAKLEAAEKTPGKPVVFYGTSITHGACASRPGMALPAILGRRLGRPAVNLGFSGNGKLEVELARLIGEIDAAAYVVDCLPNCDAAEVAARTKPFVLELRKARPHTPVVLVEDRTYANAHSLPGVARRSAASRAALREAFDGLTRDGVASLHYLEGPGQLGDDDEGTVDSSHPNDLGFQRQADAFEPKLRYVLAPGPAAKPFALDGYTDRQSYAPGDRVALHVTCAAPTFDLTITRAGAKDEVVHAEKGIKGAAHPVPDDASANGCRWPASRSFTVPEGWRSGYYRVRLEAGKGHAASLFFVVRAATPGATSKVLLQLSTNTYNADTNWGGYSLYGYHAKDKVQGRRVSFLRPQNSQFDNWEAFFVRWAEANGWPLEYAVNQDLEERPELLKAYKLVLSVGHDEYWSGPMRDGLEAYVAGGGNVAFFSGNTCCWQVRAEDGGRALVCYKQAYRADPLFAKGERKALSTTWSHHLVGRPENSLTGVGFLHGGYHKSHGQLMDGSGAFTAHRPEHWLFEGTGLKRGEAFGAKYKVVGYECDGCELTWKDGTPTPTRSDGTPEGFTVLATAPARWAPDDCEWYERWERGRTGHAVVGTYTRGGTVVTVGTTDWARGLRGDPAVVRITENVLRRLSR